MTKNDPAEIGKASTASEVITHLRSIANPENIAGMARYGIEVDAALGIPNSVLRPLGRTIGRNHDRADELWKSGIREARLLACFTDEKKKVSAEQARRWVKDFNSWEVVDHAASLFVDADLSADLIPEFAADEREFVRRTAFAMMAWAAVHLKKEPDETFTDWFPLITVHAKDGRNFVKKAVHWALRQIGKRNRPLNAKSIALAETLISSDDKATRSIGKITLAELASEKVQDRLQLKAAKAGQ